MSGGEAPRERGKRHRWLSHDGGERCKDCLLRRRLVPSDDPEDKREPWQLPTRYSWVPMRGESAGVELQKLGGRLPPCPPRVSDFRVGEVE